MSAWAAGLLAAGATALLVPGRARVVPSGAAPPRPRPSTSVARLASRRRRTAEAAAVLEACDVMAAELEAGRPVGVALNVAAARWPVLAPVEESLRLGADVPRALRTVADHTAAADELRLVAAAWQVAAESGHGLARALHRVGDGLRRRARTRRVVESELASARSTARLVALLPIAVLVMGRGAGSDPWEFLLGSPVGGVCLVGGLGFLAAGLAWIELIAARATR